MSAGGVVSSVALVAPGPDRGSTGDPRARRPRSPPRTPAARRPASPGSGPGRGPRRARRPGPEGSGAKLRGSATFKATVDAAVGVLGPSGVAGSDADAVEWRTLFLTAPSISIRGGTDEIQRNIIGEHVLGLPPEPRVDTDRPWNEVPR